MSRKQVLEIICISGAILAGFWIPLHLLGYLESYELELFFSFLIPIVAGSHIALYFSRPDMNWRSLQLWLNFGLLLDLLCVVPFSFISILIIGKTTGSLLFVTLLTARHVRLIKGFLDHFDNLQPITYRLIPIFLVLPLLLHLIACGWIALGSGTIGPESDKVLEYVRGLYWSFTTLTTVGYGDISAKTIPQMLYACGVQVTGVGVFGFIISNVASLLARKDAARENHMDNLDKIETYMRTHRIPGETRHKVRSYYNYMWKNKKGYRDKSVVENLPKKIQSELFLHINRPVLEKVPFLKGASHDLVEDLMHELEPRISAPGEKIFRLGDEGDAMYIIHRGQVEIIGSDSKIKAVLHEGAFFGEMALLEDRKRTATARAVEFCDLYVLKKEAFSRVCQKYPEFLEHVHEIMRQRNA